MHTNMQTNKQTLGSTFGAVLGSVTSAASAIDKTFDTVNRSINLANNQVRLMETTQLKRHRYQIAQLDIKLRNEAIMAKAQQNAEIRSFFEANPGNKDLFIAAEAELDAALADYDAKK